MPTTDEIRAKKILVTVTIATFFLGRIAATRTRYDFIIVGAGSAGSVIANRLSEIPDWQILLLETGEFEDPLTQIPFAAPMSTFSPYSWKYVAEYQEGMSSGLVDQRMLWPLGRGLGGGSVINFMIYARGNKIDYDRWAIDNPGWSYDEVLPYFIKSEHSHLKNVNEEMHGHDGYLQVSNIHQSKLLDAFIQAGNELGLPSIDYNANYQSFGVSPMHATVYKGARNSAGQAFIKPVLNRNNLHIVTSAFVTKLLIDSNNKEAYGVEYERFGQKYTVIASREVILCAGTFNTPKLLMLAGIGPKSHLQQLDIPLLVDLPVGQNLHDHIAFMGLNFIINAPLSISVFTMLNPFNILNYIIFGNGPYSALAGLEGIGYIKTNVSQEVEDLPDIELVFADGCISADYGLIFRKWLNIKQNVYNRYWGPIENQTCWTIVPMLLHPKSKGHLKLKSTDPYDKPALYGNYFTDPEDHDIKTMVAGIRFIQRLAATRAFQQYDSTLSAIAMPGCEQKRFDSDDYWGCVLRAIGSTFHHQSGTAKMGPVDDPTAVVDHELRVHGIGRLRVADCSVIPFALSAHMNAVAIMLGEKASDLIKKTWNRSNPRT